ncbi:acyl-CoA dehydrogenase family protein [Paenibacillus lemnae]|uniref:Acyl-CoA/acyl-ACP dehydrogenase n=1 Tax=Paenibacillus lemnae TaxID=1330551 RepID=A0A848M7Z0_PAELE|nr:acyl-CoA dehydrogenase family protein [Paenibacillus lemnae]NMO97137.1 acyl-CoA/acyl-ACP dehydrogenase [Paenibacillus lemnae]
MSFLRDQYIRNTAEQERLNGLRELAARFAQRAPEHDRDGSFPFENFKELREGGYLRLTVPKAYGGEEISLYELVQVQECLGHGDGSTALGFGWHIGQILQLRTTGKWPETLFAELCQDIVKEGAMINVFGSESGTGSPSRGGKPATIAERTDGGWLISGRKTFSTLSPILDRFVVTATLPEDGSVSEFLVHRSEQVKLIETWNTMGMRATGSHDVVLEQAFAAEDARITGSGTDDGSGWLLHIPACYAGIAMAARDFAVHFASTYTPNSLPGPIGELPTVRQSIGQMEAELRTARSLLYEAADTWDQKPELRPHMRSQLGLAKHIVTNHALNVVDLAMRIVGGTSLSKTLPLERYYRDIRAGLFNPPMDNMVMELLAKEALSEMDSLA